MKIISYLIILLSYIVNFSSYKPKITHYVDETVHDFVLTIPHLKHEGILTFNKEMKWSLVEKTDGVVVRTQTGNYRIEKAPYTQNIILDRIKFYHINYGSTERSEYIDRPIVGKNLALYFDEVGNLNYSGESGYIYYKR
jgi:hypothetical protein